MLLSSKMNLLWYLLGTIANFLQFFILRSGDWKIWIIFLIGILLNQLILFKVLGKIVRGYGNWFIVTLGVIGKLFFVLAAFFVALNFSEIPTAFLIYSYIFQLIILIFSIKR